MSSTGVFATSSPPGKLGRSAIDRRLAITPKSVNVLGLAVPAFATKFATSGHTESSARRRHSDRNDAN